MTADDAGWDYKPDGETKKDEPQLGNRGSRPPAKKVTGPTSIEWQAHEYVDHSRGASWYMGLIVIAIILAAAIYFLTKDYIASVIVVVTAIVIAVFSMQKPREVTYNLGADGLRINEKLYLYGHFKSFAVVREEGSASINLIPTKRFLPAISLYFEPGLETRIVQILGRHLPYEEHDPDRLDRISRRLRL